MSTACEYRCVNEERIRILEQGQTETKVYVKDIKEDLQEIKSELKKGGTPPKEESAAKTWQPIILELIKTLSTAITILGTIVGAAKLLGK